jgi:hypothetical protein
MLKDSHHSLFVIEFLALQVSEEHAAFVIIAWWANLPSEGKMSAQVLDVLELEGLKLLRRPKDETLPGDRRISRDQIDITLSQVNL